MRQRLRPKLLVTGGNGLLGGRILEKARERYGLISVDLQEESLLDIKNVYYHRLDITEPGAIQDVISRSDPQCVFHTAAFTEVDGCEADPELAWKVNVEGTRNVANACSGRGIKMIHLSTDYVFDGENGPYRESDPVHPLNQYGKTKLESENIVLGSSGNSVIARTMVLYGFAPGIRMNFVTWLIGHLGKGKRASVVTDQYGTPTLADDLAETLIKLFEKDASGVYHTAGSEQIDRYSFALRIAGIFGLDASLIGRSDSAQFKQLAKRPLVSGLITEKVTRDTGFRFHGVGEGLKLMKRHMIEAGYHFEGECDTTRKGT